jgi:ubiquinone biosynthesis protein UbiJ
MATQFPFPLLEGFFQNLPLPSFHPPLWAVEEMQRRIVSILNHILAHESEATSRLARKKTCVVLIQWRSFTIRLLATPAGLLDLAPVQLKPDLILSISEESAAGLAQTLLRGDRPAVRIEGDVQLAAELNWLVDHVRWDIEEDLAKVLGDAAAHSLGQATRALTAALRRFAASAAVTADSKASA